MKVSVSDLSGPALDWAVAKCEGCLVTDSGFYCNYDGSFSKLARFSTDWAQGGPIIEREIVSLDAKKRWKECAWRSDLDPLIAALRCYVSSKMGNEIEVPDELYNS